MPFVKGNAQVIAGTPLPGEKQVTQPYYTSASDRKDNYGYLLANIDGFPLILPSYFEQQVGKDDELSPFQPNQLTIYQQYHRIVNYEIRLQGSFNVSGDPSSGEFTITGTADVFPYLIPKKGDAFLADIGNGRLGIFSVTEVTPKTILPETTHQIEFILSEIATDDLVQQLINRVVKTSYFRKDYLLYGRNPVITAEALNDNLEFGDLTTDLVNYWSRAFYSRNYSTFLVPGQEGSGTYDPYVTRFMKRIIPQRDFPSWMEINQLNCDGHDNQISHYSLWDSIEEVSADRLSDTFKTCTALPVRAFDATPIGMNIYYSGLSYVVIAKDRMTTVDDDYEWGYPDTGINMDAVGTFNQTAIDDAFTAALVSINAPISDSATPEDSIYFHVEVPTIRPIATDDQYVVDAAFYDQSEDQTKLEIMLNAYLRRLSIDSNALKAMAKTCRKWGRLEQYYYIPIVIALLKYMVKIR